MDYAYAITPFVAWLTAGSLKFLVNSARAGKPAFGLIGYGGLPSNHSAIVSSMAALIALREGIGSPAFGVALTLAFIVILDASSLRKQIGRQAVAIKIPPGSSKSHAVIAFQAGIRSHVLKDLDRLIRAGARA